METDNKNLIKLSDGTEILFKDFEKNPPTTKFLRVLLNTEGLVEIFGGDLENAKMGEIFNLFPHVVESVTKEDQTIEPTVEFVEDLPIKEGVQVYTKISEVMGFLAL